MSKEPRADHLDTNKEKVALEHWSLGGVIECKTSHMHAEKGHVIKLLLHY